MLGFAVAMFAAVWYACLAVLAMSLFVSVPLWALVCAGGYVLTSAHQMILLTYDVWRHGIRNDRL